MVRPMTLRSARVGGYAMERLGERGDYLDLYGQLLRDCDGMAKYALTGGNALPAAVA